VGADSPDLREPFCPHLVQERRSALSFNQTVASGREATDGRFAVHVAGFKFPSIVESEMPALHFHLSPQQKAFVNYLAESINYASPITVEPNRSVMLQRIETCSL